MGRTAAGPVSIALSAFATVFLLAQCGPPHSTGKPLTPSTPISDFAPPGSGDPSHEAAGLQNLAKAFVDFHNDTGGWPYGIGAWYARALMGSPQIWPGIGFTNHDTAMFLAPPDIPGCDQLHAGGWDNPCWNGPYLKMAADETTPSLANTPWLDSWGHPRLFSYVRPWDGMGGGIDRPQALSGMIFLWSRGPDGVDGFTCSDADGPCHEVDINAYVNGLCSQQQDCDDIIVQVSTTAF